MPGKIAFHREDHIAGKENVHAQNERHTEIEIQVGPGPALDRPQPIDQRGNSP